MFALARLLLVCLLAAALPVQGFAAAAMESCAPGHSSPAARPGVGGHGNHTDSAPAAHPGEPSAPPLLDADPASAAQLQCGAGAACCMAAALSSAAPALPVVKPAIEPAATPAAAYAGPYCAGLERPPKSAFA